jgi:hypothetical protein
MQGITSYLSMEELVWRRRHGRWFAVYSVLKEIGGLIEFIPSRLWRFSNIFMASKAAPPPMSSWLRWDWWPP